MRAVSDADRPAGEVRAIGTADGRRTPHVRDVGPAARRRGSRWLPALVALLGLALVAGGTVLARSSPVARAADLGPAATAVLPRTDLPRRVATPAGGPPTTTAAAPVPTALPVSVALPRQRATGRVVPVGVTRTRALDLPADPRTVGWWAGSSVPGAAAGPTVLAGHVDSVDRGLGTFAALLTARLGDEVDVTTADGAVHRYRVSGRTTYRKSALPASVFRTDGAPGLTLVTCGGPFDTATHHYRDNVVTVAVPV